MTYYPPVRQRKPPVVYRPTLRQAIVSYLALHERVNRRRLVDYAMLMYGCTYGSIRNELWQLTREGVVQRVRKCYCLV